MNISKNNGGLVLGTLLGAFHLLWAILVATGVAQPLMNWVFSLHFLNNPYQVGAFDIGTAATLVIFTFVVGYVVGWLVVFAMDMTRGKK